MKKSLALGTESFPDMILGNSYYVDKTVAIKPLMLSGKYVQLITRPRRFGKTLFMDMLRTFLDVDLSEPGNTAWQEKLFAGLAIRNEQAFCDEFMGQYPVLLVSLREVKGLTFESAMTALAETVQPIAERYADLLKSPRLTEDDKTYLQHCLSREYLLDPGHQADLRVFLSKMTAMLARHFERQTVLLIDEYDVPLQKAVNAGYYPKMLEFMQSFVTCLKAKEGVRVKGRLAIRKAVVTGCLRVSKASIFTDVNNFDVNTVCMQGGALATAIGFTADEVNQLLSYYGLSDKRDTVKTWYDGYRFGQSEIYCPWDVIHYCSDILDDGINRETFQPQNYWAETSSNDVIDEFLGFLTQDDTDKMQTLLDGGVIEFEVNEEVTYDDFDQHEPDDFWTLLLFTGYLTVVSQEGDFVRVRIPNKEIQKTFASRVLKKFSKKNPSFVHCGEVMVAEALQGDADGMQNVISGILDGYVSVRDAATRAKAENFYHGFLSALVACAGKAVGHFSSNAEAGDGYADILFTSPTAPRIGVVIEIKHCAKPGAMESSASKALQQIEDKRYVRGLLGLGCREYYGYGIAFSGKSCVVIKSALVVP